MRSSSLVSSDVLNYLHTQHDPNQRRLASLTSSAAYAASDPVYLVICIGQPELKLSDMVFCHQAKFLVPSPYVFKGKVRMGLVQQPLTNHINGKAWLFCLSSQRLTAYAA
ncbi:MAG: hypothetical protein ACTH58_04225 [Marinomonas foliarum]|uniref:hypothetical protein n=1 Tax=Marinomonas foliarum TaxID=491950 RepID=UPI003F9836D6